MKILQLAFIPAVFGSVRPEKGFSGMEMDGVRHYESFEDTARAVPGVMNRMHREGSTQPTHRAPSVVSRFVSGCIGCCLPGCFEVQESTQWPQGGSLTDIATTQPILPVFKEHDSGEDDEELGGGERGAVFLSTNRSPRGMSLRRRQGTSPTRTLTQPVVTGFNTAALLRSDDKSTSGPQFSPDTSDTDGEGTVYSPIIVQSSQNVYPSSTDISQEPTQSTEAPETSSFETTSLADHESTTTGAPTTDTTTLNAAEQGDFIVIGTPQEYEEDEFVVIEEPVE
jgi:hypothetical protein